MNRFRTKKKTKEDSSAAGRSSSEEQPSHSAFKFRRGKKTQDEEKNKSIDLSNALPPTDDFRTSLLMTGLSARFSMLREQDDPSTKIGKASDDSVLFPSKRQSRLMMELGLGGRGLDDIAEVESIRAPPFLRADSYASDSESLQGRSIMERTRPTEGNNLFGGRQKIYRIPAGASAKADSDGGKVMAGRAMYEDDVALSAFQKQRQREKDRLAQLNGYDDDELGQPRSHTGTTPTTLQSDTFDSSSLPRSDSPSPVGYNFRRDTASTASSAARNSTAATSVASQPTASAKDWLFQNQFLSGHGQPPHPSPPTAGVGSSSSSSNSNSNSNNASATVERSTTTRTRRLYENGLNQDLHEQQSSALSRIDTLTGKRLLGARTPDLNHGAPSPTSHHALSDRFGLSVSNGAMDRRHLLSKASAPNLRSISPPTNASPRSTDSPPDFASSLKLSTGLSDGRNAGFSGTPPLSPPVSDSGDLHPHLPIQPSDRGKATAMGVFQKPALPYDESRFAQRQLQLQQGRETPTRRFRAESNASHATGMSSRSSSVAPAPLQPQPQSQQHQQLPSSFESKKSASPSPVPTAVVSSAASIASVSVDGKESTASSTAAGAPRRTFLFDDEDDEHQVESQPAAPVYAASAVAPMRPSDEGHPAFRHLAAAERGATTTSPVEARSPMTVVDHAPDDPEEINGLPIDSPTLGPGAGLGTLVRQHLRSTSNASSVYSTMSPQTNYASRLSVAPNDDNEGGLRLLDMKSNPWDDNDWSQSIRGVLGSLATEQKHEDQSQAQSQARPQAQPQQQQQPTLAEPQQPSSSQLPPQAPHQPRHTLAQSDSETSSSSHADSKPGSLRGGLSSPVSESLKGFGASDADKDDDEDDFAHQLANARRRVQERLTTFVESDSSRGTSPLLAPTEPSSLLPLPSVKSTNPLGLLRGKSSRGSLMERSRDVSQPSKAMKMLGIGSATMSTSPSPSKQSFEDEVRVPALPSLKTLAEGPETKAKQGYEPAVAAVTPTATTATAMASPPETASASAPADPSVASRPSATVATPTPPPSSSPRTSGDGNGESVEAESGLQADSSVAPDNGELADDDEANMHPGLRAFRNARRQLQKRKELETLARHQPDGTAASPGPSQHPPSPDSHPPPVLSPMGRRGAPLSSLERDRKPPPVYYQQREPSQESHASAGEGNARSEMESRASSRTERDRSGSDNSNHGAGSSSSRQMRQGPPPRLRNTMNQGPSGHDGFYSQQQQQHQQHPHQPGNGHLGAPRGPMGMRSPGLPGTDIRRSPHMPPQGSYLGSSSAGRLGSNTYDPFSSGQPSPISPLGSGLGLPPSPFYASSGPGSSNGGSGATTPTGVAPRMQRPSQAPSLGPGLGPGLSQGQGQAQGFTTTSTLTEAMKKVVRKEDISEPTFIMSTSRVPTVSLPHSMSAPEVGSSGDGKGGRSRSGSRSYAGTNGAGMSGGFAPPLPPINPLRNKSAARGPRGIIGGGYGGGRRNGGEGGDDANGHAAGATVDRPGFARPAHASDDEDDAMGGSTQQRMVRRQKSEAAGMHGRMVGAGLPPARMELPGGMI